MEDEEEFQEETKEKGTELMKEIEPICDIELGSEDVIRQPILKPVANINNSFMDTQRLLNKSLLDYKRIKQTINGMLTTMPKYSQTIIIAELQKLVNYVEQVIFLADHQQETLRRTITEMIQISGEKNEFVGGVQAKEIQIEEEIEPNQIQEEKNKLMEKIPFEEEKEEITEELQETSKEDQFDED